MDNFMREKARTQCAQWIAEIRALERDGAYGSRRWHDVQRALGRALRLYRECGATFSDIAGL